MEYPERDVEKNKVFECTCDGLEEQECNYCELKNIIPFNEVKTIIKVKKIQNFETTPFLCKIDESIFEKYFHDQENYDIEIRCLRMDENYKN